MWFLDDMKLNVCIVFCERRGLVVIINYVFYPGSKFLDCAKVDFKWGLLSLGLDTLLGLMLVHFCDIYHI